MSGSQNKMPGGIDQRFFCDGEISPEHENQSLPVIRQAFDRCIGKCFPTLILMRTGHILANGEGRIEEKNALAGPGCKITG